MRPASQAVLSSRGFAEMDRVDFSALSRNECISTHRARLPACIIALGRRAKTCPDVLEQAMAQRLVDVMRLLPEPAGEGAAAPTAEGQGGAAADADGGSTSSGAAEAAVPADGGEADPWAKPIKGFGH